MDLIDRMRDDVKKVLSDKKRSFSDLLGYVERIGDPIIDDDGNTTQEERCWTIRCRQTIYRPGETDIKTNMSTHLLNQKIIESGVRTFHIINNPDPIYTTPENGLHIEPDTSAYLIFQGHSYEIFAWDERSDGVEYRIHATRMEKSGN